jgi:hypothetical protein
MADLKEKTHQNSLLSLFNRQKQEVANTENDHCNPCVLTNGQSDTNVEKPAVISKESGNGTNSGGRHNISEKRTSVGGGTHSTNSQTSHVSGSQKITKTTTSTTEKNNRNLDLRLGGFNDSHTTDINERRHITTETFNYDIERQETDLLTVLNTFIKGSNHLAKGTADVLSGAGEFIGGIPPVLLKVFELAVLIVKPISNVVGSFTLPEIRETLTLIADRGISIAAGIFLISATIIFAIPLLCYFTYCILSGIEIVSPQTLFYFIVGIVAIAIIGIFALSLLTVPKQPNNNNP